MSRLLFAVDIALLTLDPASLQNQLDALDLYSNKGGLNVMLIKLKYLCIFETREHSWSWIAYLKKLSI